MKCHSDQTKLQVDDSENLLDSNAQKLPWRRPLLHLLQDSKMPENMNISDSAPKTVMKAFQTEYWHNKILLKVFSIFIPPSPM